MPAANTWISAEEVALVAFLHDNRAEAGDGGSFKKSTFQRAAQYIASFRGNGQAKDVKSCQNKWTALRKIYRVIQAIKEVSGWHWDDETGASITPATSSSWDDYVRKHPAAKPFRNKGWVHLHKVADIMPSTISGSNVYHPTGTHAPALAAESNPSELSPAQSVPPSPTGPQVMSMAESDNGGSDDELPQVASAFQKRARPASPARPAAKRSRKSGADALNDLSLSLSDFGTKISSVHILSGCPLINSSTHAAPVNLDVW
jgi:hypothetical protein